MTAIPTPFGTVAGKYPFLGSMSLKNCYVEKAQGEKSKYNIVPSEGLVSFSAVTDTPSRGSIFLEDLNVAYSFHSSSVYKIASDGTAIRIGTVPGTDTIEVTRNTSDPPQITLTCSRGVFDIISDVVTLFSSTNLPDGVVSVETLGEFTLFGIGDNEDASLNGRVYYSTQGDTTLVSAVDFFTAEQSPDTLVKLKVSNGELFIFGQNTTENWIFSGADVDTPFIYRTTIQRGCLARDTVKTCDGTILWAGQSKEGEKGVYRLAGYAAKKISTNEIDRLIEAEADPSVLKAFSYGRAGHSFYCLKGTGWTRTYDAATDQWHTRDSYGLEVWRAQHCFAAWNKIIFGDQETGVLFSLADNTFTENGGVMVAEMTSPFLHAFPKGGVIDRVSLDLLVGSGVTSPTAQGYDPIVMISKSVDGGNTWSYPRELKLGKQGQDQTRVNTRRYGRFGSKGVAFRIAISDPVGRSLALLDAAVRPLAA